ncbi:MAG TPA: TadE/TadG family type IV pilus assembly protein [Rhodospirillales bacterium]|nr:TadE/TadG family type IV pilus assembly protein [Rhodospirillales bacterium]
MRIFPLIGACRTFRRDERGSPVVEFAIGGPVFFLMVCAIVEFGLVMFVIVLMESSLRDASRYGLTGQLPDGASTMSEREAFIRELVEDRTLGLVDFDKAVLDIRSYPTFDDVARGEDFVDGNTNGKYDGGETFKDCNANGKRDDDRGAAGAGESGAVVVYRLRYDWPLITPMMSKIIGTDGKFPLSASVAVRNEPWNPSLDGTEPKPCTL